jgi:hypothetical protein
MGNFSRNTFDPTKNYVGVRLQQGVPLVDADWNELDDAIRSEIYNGFSQIFPDGVEPGSQSLQIVQASAPANNLAMTAGAILVGGRPLRVPTAVNYTAQPWFNNPARALQDGVAVIPLLTTPNTNRTDLVFLDVWEREVRSTEDANLINHVIGVETCVRVKREFAIRVAEGTQTLPAPPAGHSFMPLALLHRVAQQANILAGQIEDMRPKIFSTRGTRALSFVPALLPVGGGTNPWFFDSSTNSARTNTASALSLLPLLLPEGATLLSVRIQGITGECYFLLWRKQLTNAVGDQLFNSGFSVSGIVPTEFDSVFTIPSTNRMNIVDNTRYNYFMWITNGQKPTTIARVTVNYQY